MGAKQRAKRTAKKAEEPTVGPGTEVGAEPIETGARVQEAVRPVTEPEEKPMEPMADLLARAESAYTTYMEAQKKVARAYRGHELQHDSAYTEAERQANAVCNEEIEKALKVCEQAEQQAENAHREAIEQAKRNYEDSVRQALRVRQETVEHAWASRNGAIERAWKIFAKETD